MFGSLVFLMLFVHGVDCLCDRYVGPSGSNDCPALDNRTQSNCLTCVSDAYTERSSVGECQRQTYCYYQCMLESDLLRGSVYDRCGCSKDRPATVDTTELVLPSECYHPSGKECSWYIDCLAFKYPCTGSKFEYAVTFGFKICNFYEERRSHFSFEALKWLDVAKKCLQVSLAPLLEKNGTVTCEEIQDTAFDSHAGCYLHPYPGFSVCSLTMSDFLQIFWTVKSGFVGRFVKTLDQFFQTGFGCITKWITTPNYQTHEILELELQMIESGSIVDGRRPTSSSVAIASHVMDSISSQLSWAEYPIDWHPFISDSILDDKSHFRIILFIADTNNLGLTNKGTSLGMSHAIASLSNAIKHGGIRINIPDQPGNLYVGTALKRCLQFQHRFCSSVVTLAVLPNDHTLESFVVPSGSDTGLNVSPRSNTAQLLLVSSAVIAMSQPYLRG